MLGRTLAVALIATLLVGAALGAWAQTSQSNFATTDLNDDGVIDREEYHRRMMDTMFFADGDSDGMLASEEFENSRFDDFEAADQDGSGTLSPAEVDAWR